VKHLRQRTKTDCLLTSLACLIPDSYKEVKRVFGPCRGVSTRDAKWIVSHFSAYRYVKPRKPYTLHQWVANNPKSKAVVVVETSMILFGIGHAVAVDNGEIWNPSDGSSDCFGNVLEAYVLI